MFASTSPPPPPPSPSPPPRAMDDGDDDDVPLPAVADEPPSSKNATAESKREREFRRYAEVVLGLHTEASGQVAASSADVSLTAFAQLVALRLNAKRALVSLFDKRYQYILAEATQTLSLQQDEVHAQDDALHFGKSVRKREDDFISDTIKVIRRTKRRPSASIDHAAISLLDTANDERTSSHPLVTGPPFVRAYAGVPLLNHAGFAIGSLAILDDQPRERDLSDPEIKFMQDVAASIVSHLNMKRVQASYDRGLRLVHGLSRFIEGKDSLDVNDGAGDDENSNALHGRQTLQTSTLRASPRTEAMNAANNAERLYDVREAEFLRRKRSPAEARGEKTPRHEKQTLPSEKPLSRKASHHLTANLEQPMPGLSPQSSQLQQDAISKDVPEMFDRAAKILKQAMKLETVLFLDATAGSFGSLRSSNREGDDNVSHPSDSSSASTVRGDTDNGSSPGRGHSRNKPCRYLARVYDSTVKSGGDEHLRHGNIPERFLRSILKRFGHGKIYNFGDDGLLTSSDHSDGNDGVDLGSDVATQRRLNSRRSDSLRLQKIFPGVRCVGVMPMFDSLRSRYYAGAVVLSYDPLRLFSFKEDVNYLGAFCDVVMAEVGRLDVQADVKSKTSFIASISHELRSPLHGILGGVECLQDQSFSATAREEMVQMIDTCGRSLLDIVNNLLDHSHVKSAESERKHAPAHYRRRKRRTSGSSQAVHDLSLLTEEVLNSSLWSTPTPTQRSKTLLPGSQGLERKQLPLKVAFDIDISNLPNTGWSFYVNSGAWRRILQNLTSNAIKYTDEGGFLQISLSVGEEREEAQTRIVTLRCTDSGRGFSRAYLQSGLWQAFSQEDNHASGTGLGLSLVHGLVQGIGGTIDVQSQQGVGTTIKTQLPLLPGVSPGADMHAGMDLEPIRDKSYRLMGFDASAEHSPRAAESMKVLRASVDTVCRSLTMTQAEVGEEPDVYVVTEEALLAKDPETVRASSSKPSIVLCDSITSAQAASSSNSGLTKAQYVSQPLGPRRLLKALAACLAEGTQDGGPSDDVVAQTQLSRSRTKSFPAESPRPAEDASSTVLVVDDNPINLHLLQRYMTRLGRSQVGATNGQEALDTYITSLVPIDIILMDITMPVMDGLESTRRIRAHERSSGSKKRVMIVTLTAMAGSSARQDAYSSGVDLFLTKPVQFAEIRALFEEWAGGKVRKDDEGGVDGTGSGKRPSSRRGCTT
ncbi:sensor histidine kinase response regulator [Lecanosticta acicola]|uniref:histidine kinase n=1 Tax=Lecanosticta acicola TaxID=111012 RepID=A0AAI8W143_9PEZI|nr:sensor histidine kinase response regulator [Lecanosticta acicola]